MSQPKYCGQGEYEIVVKGHLDEERSYWFEGLTMITGLSDDGTPITTFTGQIADQTALHGMLGKIRDMNLPLISVTQVKANSKDESQTGSEGGASAD